MHRCFPIAPRARAVRRSGSQTLSETSAPSPTSCAREPSRSGCLTSSRRSRSSALRRRSLLFAAVFPIRAQAATKRFREIDDLAAGRMLFLDRHGALRLEKLLEGLAVDVGVLGGVPLARHLLDERARHLEVVLTHRGELDIHAVRLAQLRW